MPLVPAKKCANFAPHQRRAVNGRLRRVVLISDRGDLAGVRLACSGIPDFSARAVVLLELDGAVEVGRMGRGRDD